MEKKLKVKMFGGFSVNYGEKAIALGRQRNSKFRQLFQLLMTSPKEGFSKSDIIRNLYGWEDVEDSNASLNNLIFRLRKYLEESALPAGDYLPLNDGVLRFGGNTEVESDVWDFERTAEKFEKETDDTVKRKLCWKAWGLYRGEFLPALSNEQWVIAKSQTYQKRYFEMLEYLLSALKEDGDYREVEFVSAAAEIYPYCGWEIWQIESMIALGHHKKAEEVYKKTVAYLQKTGGFLSKKQRERFYELGNRIQRPEGIPDDIKKCLVEPDPRQGAYFCAFPNFLTCFRMLKRVMLRDGGYFSLLLCTILDLDGRPANDPEYCRNRGDKLRESFRTYLRKGDAYTMYSANQYLLLCIGAGKDNISEIGTRIDMDFRKRCNGRGGISFRLLDDGNIW